MSDLDESTLRWLRSLKLSRELKSIRDFHNGYYFGEVLTKMGLATKQAFHNKNDLSCIFHNYKQVRDVLNEKLGIDLPTDNLVGKSKEILLILQQQSQALKSGRLANNTLLGKKDTTQKFARTLDMDGTQGLPRKIVVIQEKLQKFRDEHQRQQQSMKEEQKKDLAIKDLVVQEKRRDQREKLQLTHNFVKEQDKKIFDIWNKTQQVKLERIGKQTELKDFLWNKKQNQIRLERQSEVKGFEQGMSAFEENCLRLGIDIQHDNQNPARNTKKEFNKTTFMERIADKSQKEEIARKDKVKRMNNLQVMRKDTASKAEKVYEEQSLVDKYVRLSNSQSKQSQLFKQQQRRHQFQSLRKSEQAEIQVQKKKEISIVFDQQKQRVRQDEYRQKRIDYMQINLARKTMKREKHQQQMREVIDKLISISCECYDDQKNSDSEQVNTPLWNDLFAKFVEDTPTRLERADTKNTNTRFVDPQLNKTEVQGQLQEYIAMKGSWICTESRSNEGMVNQSMSDEVAQLIDLVYPPHSTQVKEKLPTYMPLKLCLLGSTLSGRHTQAQKLSQKYGVNIIDLKQIIKEALTLASPPVDDKKGAKKDTKKGQEQKPEKARLRELGLRLKEKIKAPEEADNQCLLEVFIFKVKQLFPEKGEQQVKQQFVQAQQRAVQKHAQAIKEYEQAQKKLKKDPKKPATNEPDNPPKISQTPYSKGFVVVGFPDNLQMFVEFQKSITGYLTPEERVNHRATQSRDVASQVVYIQPRKPIQHLKESSFDHVIHLEVAQEKLNERNQGRKLDPATGISYHSRLNPAVPEIKGMVDQPTVEIVNKDQQACKVDQYYKKRGLNEPNLCTFQKVGGDQSPAQVFRSVETILQQLLVYKTRVLNPDGFQDQPKVQAETVTPQLNQQVPPTTAQPAQPLVDRQPQQQALPPRLTLGQPIAAILLKKFHVICDTYSTDISTSLLKLRELRQFYISEFGDTESDLLNIILRPDDKNIKILGFQESYNKLLAEKEGLVHVEQAKTHLLDKLDKLYDGLWESICDKKNEAVQFRREFMEGQWLDNHVQRILETAEVLLQVQLDKSIELVGFEVCLRLASTDRELLQGAQHVSFEPFADGNIPPLFDESDGFPRLQKITQSFHSIVDSIPTRLKNRLQAQGVDLADLYDTHQISLTIQQVLRNLHLAALQINSHIQSRLREYSILFQLLLNRMDDWIIFGIKRENDIAYGHIKQIKRAINEGKKSIFQQSVTKQIHNIYKPYNSIPDKHVLLCQVPGILSTEDCKSVLEQLKSISDNDGKIELQLLKQFVERRLKAGLLPGALSGISLDSIQQYLVQEGCINLEEMGIALILLGYTIPSEQQIDQLYNDTVAAESDPLILFSKFLESKSFLDWEQPKRVVFVKYSLSDLFGTIGQDIDMQRLCETLRTLNRIGAESFTQIVLQSR